MTMSIAAGAKPAFLSPNYFTRHADKGADLTLVSGSTLRGRLYDNDPRAQWSSAGSDDTVTETITAGLWRPGARLSHDIDYWALLNHNIKGLNVALSDDNGATYPTVCINSTTVADEDSRGVLNATTAADRIRITATTTQTANQEKLIGAVILAKLRFQAAGWPLIYMPEPDSFGVKTARMADNSVRDAKVFWSDAGFRSKAMRIGFIVDTDAELENFEALADDYEPFLFMPRPGDRARDIWLCRIRPGTFQAPPLRKSVPDVRLVEFVAEQVGRS